jgi:hypothetical protein
LGQLLAETPAGYADFYERVEDILAGPEALRDNMRAFVSSKELTASAAEITNTKRYLDEVALRQNDRELTADKMTISAQLQLSELAANPGMWPRLRNDFDRFVARYRNEYQKHHRDYYAAVTRLRESLAEAPHRLEALSLLNSIEGLGPAAGQDLARRYEALDEQLKVCNIGVTAVNVDYHSTCPNCRLPLTATPAEEEVKRFSHDLDEALKQKTRQLATEAVSRVLARETGDRMETFLAAVQASDLAALVDVMSPDLAGFINRLLAAEAIITVPTNALSRLTQSYLSLEENEIEAVVEEFRQMLKQAFAEAKRANPDKKTIRLTWR